MQGGLQTVANATNYLSARQSDQQFRNSDQDNSSTTFPSSFIAGVFVTLAFIILAGITYLSVKQRKNKNNYRNKDTLTRITIEKPSNYEAVSVASLKISQSLPNITEEILKSMELKPITLAEDKKVVRQTTLPAYSPRHQNFHRQLSHNLGQEAVPFKVCNVQQKDSVGEIKPELYKPELQKQSSSESCVVPPPNPEQLCGKLTFSLRYDDDIEGLVVKVHQAEDLPVKDLSGTSDPYIKVYLLPDRRRKFQTKVHRRNLNPVFNETFVFGVSKIELISRKLLFSVVDFDRFSRHDVIGHVTFRNIDDGDLKEECSYTMDIIKDPEENSGRGEVMVSLCYLPTAGRLTVTIIKARFLKAMDITGASDPYVKVSLVCQGKRIRKKKTTVKKSTLNPVYNEALVFDVPAENIESVSLMIKVIDYDRIGTNELIGCTAIGSTFVGNGREHWQEMIANPRKPVAQWHLLVDDIPGMPPMTPPPYSIKRLQSFDFGNCATSKECQ